MRTRTIAIISACAAAAVIAAVTLGITRPWEKTENEDSKPPVEDQIEDQTGEELFLTINGEKVPCNRYGEKGWDILIPRGWAAENNTFWPDREGHPDVWLRVLASDDTKAYGEQLTSLWRRDGLMGRTMYSGVSVPKIELTYQTGEEDWVAYEKTLDTVAKSFRLDGVEIWKTTVATDAPEVQVVENDTILFLDKMGIVVEDYAKEAVHHRMLGFSEEERPLYTGSYKLTRPLTWECGYSTNSHDYYDGFAVEVGYELADGAELPDGSDIRNGHKYEKFHLLLHHDGEEILGSYQIWSTDALPGAVAFLLTAVEP